MPVKIGFCAACCRPAAHAGDRSIANFCSVAAVSACACRFIFGMDGGALDAFDAAAEFAVAHGIAMAAFHIHTPLPGAAFYRRCRPRCASRYFPTYLLSDCSFSISMYCIKFPNAFRYQSLPSRQIRLVQTKTRPVVPQTKV